MTLLVKSRREGRDIVRVTPQSAGWRYVGFSAHRLQSGESMAIEQPGNEVCVVVLGGTVTIRVDNTRWTDIGERRDVFDDAAPYAVYVPDGGRIAVEASAPAEIGIASAPGPATTPARLIRPSQMKRFARGTDQLALGPAELGHVAGEAAVLFTAGSCHRGCLLRITGTVW